MAVRISDLNRRSNFYSEWLHRAKARGQGADFWYPYDILANLSQLDDLLTDPYRDLETLSQGRPIADFGGADGDLGFILERELGVPLEIVDNAGTNFNRLEGARFLASELDSKASIVDIDLDGEGAFASLGVDYGLVLLLGILYHLRNPIRTLETLAYRADYCLLNTRVTSLAGPDDTNIRDIPVAYLVGEAELNDDSTNFWVFSPAGLRRAVHRSGWDILSELSVGAVGQSKPDSMEFDERMLMCLKSRYRSSSGS